MRLPAVAQNFIDDDHADPDHGAEPDQVPVEAAAEHALGDRRDQRRLRRGERVGAGAGRALEAEGVVEQVRIGGMTTDPKITPRPAPPAAATASRRPVARS